MSECQTVEMSWRLARRGHDVTVFAPIPDGIKREWRGTVWKKESEIDWNAPGIWFLYRDPALLDHFPNPHPGQQLIEISQDEWYPFSDERLDKLDWLFCFCKAHEANYLHYTPGLKGKTRVTSNGLNMDLIREIYKEPAPERNPKRINFASSPDRGLIALTKIFKRAREYVPDLELHCYYGLDNIQKLIESNPKFKHYMGMKEKVEKAVNDQPGVFWHGRIPQPELLREWRKTGMMVSPTNFHETSMATIMEAQAMGAIPIVSPQWAAGENCLSGICVNGSADDAMTQAMFVAEIVELVNRPKEEVEGMRKLAMCLVGDTFNWERITDQWEGWIGGYSDTMLPAQFNFQAKHAEGKILNIGCHTDLANFKGRGAINLDIEAFPWVDVVADARNIPEDLHGKFDTVIVGDVCEHLSDEDSVAILKSAKKCLYNGGKIIVTCPDDHRPPENQFLPNEVAKYGYHSPVPIDRLSSWMDMAGLKIDRLEQIDYNFGLGHGVLAR